MVGFVHSQLMYNVVERERKIEICDYVCLYLMYSVHVHVCAWLMSSGLCNTPGYCLSLSYLHVYM